jgi:hypothetical protein
MELSRTSKNIFDWLKVVVAPVKLRSCLWRMMGMIHGQRNFLERRRDYLG